jgi:predicted nucleic acid-binding protein
MRYVLDASVALCWVLPRPLSAKALQLRDDYRKRVHQLIAPDHFPHEIANGLTKAERQKLIAVGEARKHVRDILLLAPILHPTGSLFDRAVDISSQMRCAYYDCLYVALAEREGCELVTADDRLVNSLARQFPFVIPLSSL